jgi:hypothetical protein
VSTTSQIQALDRTQPSLAFAPALSERRTHHLRRRYIVKWHFGLRNATALETTLLHNSRITTLLNISTKPTEGLFNLIRRLRPIGAPGPDAQATVRSEACELGVLQQPAALPALIVDDPTSSGRTATRPACRRSRERSLSPRISTANVWRCRISTTAAANSRARPAAQTACRVASLNFVTACLT